MKNKNKIAVFALLLPLIQSQVVLAQAQPQMVQTQAVSQTQMVGSSQMVDSQAVMDSPMAINYLTRGGAVSKVVQAFDLRNREKVFLDKCLAHMDECFFVFSTMSNYQGIRFEPLILHPDVASGSAYADDINVATMLELVHGYLDEKNSPFHANANMTRIQALKVILAAGKLMTWQERFELSKALGGEEAVDTQRSSFKDISGVGATWWYPRYVNFALSNGIIDSEENFRPNEAITVQEFNEILQRTLAK